MKALICNEYDGPAALTVQETNRPVPEEGEVLIKVVAAGVSYVDVLMSRNKHQNKHETPFSPGMEVAGVISALGSSVSGFVIGDRVAALVYDGGQAEYVSAKISEVFKLPEGCDMVKTAAALSVALTSEMALTDKAGIAKGETVLVGGAAGGIGLSAIQLAKYHGARVIAAVSSEARAETCRKAGADAALLYGADLRERVRAVNDGRDVDIVLDPVGGDFAEQAANILDWNGRYLVIGFAGGGVPKFAANRLLVKNRSVHGVVLGYYRWRKPEGLPVIAKTVLKAIAAGALDMPLVELDGLAQVPDALSKIEKREMIGKAVVKIG
ncbi:MAG: NADPH:quinone oxidoreductase family protein [Alphaproteobacteria bacterium]|nr:MAG: NADPH:quinone oxidoreductase family protein [Alphaproteobacteria bacterium]